MFKLTHFKSLSATPLGCCFISRHEKRDRRVNGGHIAHNATEEGDQKTKARKGKVRLG